MSLPLIVIVKKLPSVVSIGHRCYRLSKEAHPVKDLAQAIHSLINSKPYSPRVEELEEVIARHVPATPSGEVTRIAPDALKTVLPGLCYPQLAKGAVLRSSIWLDSAHLTGSAIVLYTQSLLLVDPRCDDRDIAGKLLKPPMLVAVWYDHEHDCITGRTISPWAVVEAIAPRQYHAIKVAWGIVRLATP